MYCYLPITKIYQPNFDIKTWDKIRDRFPLTANALIKEKRFPAPFKEYFLAKNIDYWIMRSPNITLYLDSVFNDFKNEFKTSVYVNLLQKAYNEKITVSLNNKKPIIRDTANRAKLFGKFVGKPAIDFSGMTSDDKGLSISDFLGKVVYVDVWATWCGPCREEIPYTKKLEKEFEENNQVVILFVSIDENQQAWKRLLAKDKELKGEHIIIQGEQLASFIKAYLIDGIPETEDSINVSSYVSRRNLVTKQSYLFGQQSPNLSELLSLGSAITADVYVRVYQPDLKVKRSFSVKNG